MCHTVFTCTWSPPGAACETRVNDSIFVSEASLAINADMKWVVTVSGPSATLSLDLKCMSNIISILIVSLSLHCSVVHALTLSPRPSSSLFNVAMHLTLKIWE